MAARETSAPPGREGAVGLVGLGRMGGWYARRVLAAGRRLVVLDRDPERERAWVERGARGAATAFNLTSAVDVVLLALPDSAAVEAVLEGPDGVLAALAPGQLVIDLGTTLPATDRRLAALAAARGGALLDAPAAWRGDRLTMAVGGPRAAYEQAEPLLQLLAERVGYVGPEGAGQLAKLVDQIVQAASTAALAEGLAFARGVGLDPSRTADLLELAGAETLLRGDASGHGELRLQLKDLGSALVVAQRVGLATPVTAIINEVLKATAARDDPAGSQAALSTFWGPPDAPAATPTDAGEQH